MDYSSESEKEQKEDTSIDLSEVDDVDERRRHLAQNYVKRKKL